MTNLVKYHVDQYGIATVILEDKQNKNMFNKEFIQELILAFDFLNNDKNVKVILIHGYETYFCCGGTKKELLDIYHGQHDFTQAAFYRLLLDCPLPTIAALQGHALGGGLAFASYADIMIFAQEGIYSANFMNYGFTPGMGSTLVIPQKFGQLGIEMLYTGKNYQGGELKKRGLNHTILPSQNVIELGYEKARELADKPRLALSLLKQHLTKDLKKQLDTNIEAELKMHAECFTQEEVKERILKQFAGE